MQPVSEPPQALPPSDDELMRLAAAGQRDAYETLVRRHQAALRAFCARWCGSGAQGDDVAQECFVEVWQRRASYEARGRFKAYLFHVAANRCKNQQRAHGRLRPLAALEPSEPDALVREPSSERLIASERRVRVQRSLERLPEPQREALLLRYAAELDYAEIASLLGMPEATARSRVFLGLIKLRRLLRGEKMR